MALASVILPTHSDPGTLGFAVSSVLAQVETDFELLIVGDGVDQQTRDTCLAFESLDPRIKFLDWAKGEGRGELLRDRAIKLSSGELIFYIDEDDLWLPNHIAQLSEAIIHGQADVAISVSASASIARKTIEIGPLNHGLGELRDLLAAKKYRALFKVHSCHTRSSYLRLPYGWTLNEDGENVFSLLGGLARASNSWAWVPEVTALSLHGGPRRAWGMTNEQRVEENRRYWEQIKRGELTGPKISRESSVAHYLYSVAWAIPPDGTSLGEYFAQLGIILPPEVGNQPEESLTAGFRNNLFLLTEEQENDAHCVISIVRGIPIRFKDALRIGRRLTDWVAGPPIMSQRHFLKLLGAAFRGPGGR